MEEVTMSTARTEVAVNLELDDVCFVARRILAMVKDPRTNAERLGRVIDSVGPLAALLLDTANDIFGDRGRVQTSAQAITVIGFNRLEAITRRFLYSEFARISQLEAEGRVDTGALSRSMETPLPVELPEIARVQAQQVRVGMRYAALA
jgi:hypothetical protein